MQLKVLFSQWTRRAALLLMGGAAAWALKLTVIITTNGEVIDTGAAAFLMKAGIILLLIGSTAIGSRLSVKRHLLLRIIAILISPLLLFASFLPFALITDPLLENSPVWYAQQEAPIAIAVIISFFIGYFLYRSYRPVRVYATKEHN